MTPCLTSQVAGGFQGLAYGLQERAGPSRVPTLLGRLWAIFLNDPTVFNTRLSIFEFSRM